MKITPLQNAKIIFFQKSPAVRFQHQRFRKSETKKKLMALEFGVDLFFNLGPPERQCVIYGMSESLHMSRSGLEVDRLRSDEIFKLD